MAAIFYYRNRAAPSPNQPISLGVVVLIRLGTKVLLEKRTDSDRWAFIGGKVGVEEALEVAARREVFEETGLALGELTLLKIYDDPSRIVAYDSGNVKRVVTVVYSAEIFEEPNLVVSDESEQLEFMSSAEIAQVFLAETHVPIYEDILLLAGENGQYQEKAAPVYGKV